MPTKPTEFTDWVPSGDPAYVLEPPGGQKTTGWEAEQKPPFQYFNWLFWLADQWIQWLDYIGPKPTSEILANHTVDSDDNGTNLLVDTTAGAVALQLPDPADMDLPFRFGVKDKAENFSVLACTLVRDGTEKIEFVQATYSMAAPGGQWWVFTDGVDWFLE